MSTSRENFEALFEESLSHVELRPGSVTQATVVEVRPERITVNAGLKSDAIIPIAEFGSEEVAVGDIFDVVVESVENGFGETKLSREKAIRARAWIELGKLHEAKETVQGVIVERVKGGFTVEVNSVRAFLPGSLVDIKPVRDPGFLEGRELDFKIIKMDEKRNNIVVSRRAVMEAETSAERSARLEELQEGQEVIGIVKNITDYGAFVDLGGVDGLLHITDMAWKRVKHPGEILHVGDEVQVKILKFDREKNRVSLGMKQLGEDPWANIAGRYPINARLNGVITNITDYGCFVELQEGVEGLVHMSELDWTNKNVHPSKVVKSGDEVEVMVLGIDEDRRRISLGIKQCKENPWDAFAGQHEKGDKVKGNVRSITDFGVFIGLPGDIDGLVHLSDISWSDSGENAVRDYQKGQEVEAVILAIDSERERISLGIKQLEGDPLADYLEGRDPDEVMSVTVKEVDAKSAIVQVSDTLDAILRIADYSHDHIDELSNELKAGDTLEVKVMGIDRKTHQIQVSHKMLSEKPQQRAQESASAPQSQATLGDLLREKMNKDNKDS